MVRESCMLGDVVWPAGNGAFGLAPPWFLRFGVRSEWNMDMCIGVGDEFLGTGQRHCFAVGARGPAIRYARDKNVAPLVSEKGRI